MTMLSQNRLPVPARNKKAGCICTPACYFDLPIRRAALFRYLPPYWRQLSWLSDQSGSALAFPAFALRSGILPVRFGGGLGQLRFPFAAGKRAFSVFVCPDAILHLFRAERAVALADKSPAHMKRPPFSRFPAAGLPRESFASCRTAHSSGESRASSRLFFRHLFHFHAQISQFRFRFPARAGRFARKNPSWSILYNCAHENTIKAPHRFIE